MAGYTPVFGSVFTGTLHGRWPDVGLWVCLLALADRNGELDMTAGYIASVTGLDEQTINGCMARFCEPDSESRSQDSNGSRLVLLDATRAWGWRIVNHGKYREKARLQAKAASEVEQGKNAQRMRDRRRPPLTAADPLSDSDSDSDSDSKKEDKKHAAIAAPSKPKKFAKARSQIPEGNWLTDADRTFAGDRCPDMDIDATFDDFRNHHTAKGSLSADWHASWRTWTGNCAKGFAYVRRIRKSMEKAERTYSPSEWRDLQAQKRTEAG
jgi:hypothetical protein